MSIELMDDAKLLIIIEQWTINLRFSFVTGHNICKQTSKPELSWMLFAILNLVDGSINNTISILTVFE